MQLPLLFDIVVIFALSIVVVFICHRLNVPTIVGFLITGTLAGPHAFGLIAGVEHVELLAEVGVMLLLFTIGMELSLASLLKMRRSVLLGGPLQVLLTIGASYLIARQFGLPHGTSLFVGFLLALSSTAIVLKLLQQRGEVETPAGRTALAILIFQDVVIVPMMLFTPFLAGGSQDVLGALLTLVAKGVGVIVVAVVSAKWVVPMLFFQIARTRSRELFLLTVVVLCFAVAWLTASVGLSLALGAFMAGLIISESEYSQQALGDILPFRDVFTSFFFISVGMLLDARFLLDHLGVVVLLALSVIVLKALVAGLATHLLGFPVRVVIGVGIALAQIGEFSFILSKAGMEHGLLDANNYQFFLTVSVLTMIASPFLMALSGSLSDTAMKLPLPRLLREGFARVRESEPTTRLRDHLIIVGFGLNGQNVAHAAADALIPYEIIEMNPETVRQERAKGESIHYGDATQPTVLEHAGVQRARVIVVAISDAAATRRIVETSRRINPALHIIARTRFTSEVKPLYALGADEIIPEEFETSVEIFTRVLRSYLIPKEQIEKFIKQVRADGYEMLRTVSSEGVTLADLGRYLQDVEISTFQVAENCALVGKSLAQLALRSTHGVSVLAIRRQGGMIPNPGATQTINTGDVLIIMGPPDRVSDVMELFKRGCSR